MLPRERLDVAMTELETEWDGELVGEHERHQYIIDQLHEYFNGRRQTFELQLDLHGTPFQMQVWQALRSVRFGQTQTYGWLAEAIGNPKAVRAVGGANHANPVPIIIPCHRIIGADGSLTGFGGGLPLKKALLEWEQEVLTHEMPTLFDPPPLDCYWRDRGRRLAGPGGCHDAPGPC